MCLVQWYENTDLANNYTFIDVIDDRHTDVCLSSLFTLSYGYGKLPDKFDGAHISQYAELLANDDLVGATVLVNHKANMTTTAMRRNSVTMLHEKLISKECYDLLMTYFDRDIRKRGSTAIQKDKKIFDSHVADFNSKQKRASGSVVII